MTYSTTIVKCLIASPSDVATERTAATAVIEKWNATYSGEFGLTISPVKWETHAFPELAGDPTTGRTRPSDGRRRGYSHRTIRDQAWHTNIHRSFRYSGGDKPYYGRTVRAADRRTPLTWSAIPADYDVRIRVLAPVAVDQAAVRCSYGHESVGNSAAPVSTTATNTRSVTRCAVKMSRKANRVLARPACMAGVLVSRPNRNARCGRTKL